MVEKTKILSRIKNSIQELDKDAEVILFGSQARGDAKEESDWDLLILVPHPTNLQEEQIFRHKLFELELQYGVAISTMVKSKEEWNEKFSITPLYQNISREGVEIYGDFFDFTEEDVISVLEPTMELITAIEKQIVEEQKGNKN